MVWVEFRITTGAVKTTDEEKKRFAAASHGFNIANKKFRVRPIISRCRAQLTIV
jgi:hypothetical protein